MFLLIKRLCVNPISFCSDPPTQVFEGSKVTIISNPTLIIPIKYFPIVYLWMEQVFAILIHFDI